MIKLVCVLEAFCLVLFCNGLKIISTDEKSCKVTTDEGKLDLSLVAHTDGSSAAYSATMKLGPPQPLTLVVYWNPCSDYTLAKSSGSCNQVEVCLSVTGGSWSSFGTKDQSKFVVAGDHLQIAYGEGSGVGAVTVDLICGSAEDKFEISSFTGTQVGLKLTSKSACIGAAAPGSAGGLSAGTIICIILAVLLVVYLVIGIVIMKFVKKAEGSDVVPNKTFWVSIPVYVKDGVKFTFEGCKSEDSYDNL